MEQRDVKEVNVSTCPVRMEAPIQVFLNRDLGLRRQSPGYIPYCHPCPDGLVTSNLLAP